MASWHPFEKKTKTKNSLQPVGEQNFRPASLHSGRAAALLLQHPLPICGRFFQRRSRYLPQNARGTLSYSTKKNVEPPAHPLAFATADGPLASAAGSSAPPSETITTNHVRNKKHLKQNLLAILLIKMVPAFLGQCPIRHPSIQGDVGVASTL